MLVAQIMLIETPMLGHAYKGNPTPTIDDDDDDDEYIRMAIQTEAQISLTCQSI